MLTAQCQHYLNNPNVEATQNGILMLKVVIYLVQAETAVPQWGEMVTVRTISHEKAKENDPTCPPWVIVRLGSSFCESFTKTQI